MYKKLLTLTCLLISSMSMMAQSDSVTVVQEEHHIPIWFRFDNSVIDFNYETNTQSFDETRQILTDPSVEIDSITMVAQASPEGTVKYNTELAAQRAESLRSYFTSEFPRFSDKMTFRTKLNSWKDVAVKIMHDNNVPELDQTLEILCRDLNSRAIQRQLKKVANGSTYDYLEENYLKKMRSSATALFAFKKTYHIVPPAPEPEVVDTTPVLIEQTVKYPIVALRSNLLLPLSNIGVEVPIGNRWSVAVDWYTPWIFRPTQKTWAFQLQFLNLEGRYWIGDKHKPGQENWYHRLTGHSVGAYLYGGKYDFQTSNGSDKPGHQGEFLSVGADYMYALPIFSHFMRLEFEVALGFFHNRSISYHYSSYENKLIADDKLRTRTYFNYFGPTKVGVSLVLPLCKKYKKTIKLEAEK